MRGKQEVTFPCAACSRKSASLWRWPEDGWPSQPQDSQQVLSRYHWIPVIRLGLSLQWLIFIMFIRISRLSNGPSITNIDLLSIYLPVSAVHPAVVRKGKASTLLWLLQHVWKQLFLHLSDNKWKRLRPCVCYWSYRRTLRQFDTYAHCSEGSKTLMKLQCLVSLTYTCSNTQTGVGVWQCMCNTLNTKRRDQGHYYYHHSDLFKQHWHRATVCFAKGGEKFKAWNTDARKIMRNSNNAGC